MNSRMPNFPPSPASSSDYHHNGFGSNKRWLDNRYDNPINQTANWGRNPRFLLRRNKRTWASAPYPMPVPNKGFPKFPRNNNFVGNNPPSNWSQSAHTKSKPIKSPEEKDPEQAIPGIVATKKKRKPMSKSYPSNKWDEKDAEKALQAEKDFVKNLKKQSLIIRFPDPELSKDIVHSFHSQIESVHFPQSSTPRYCFAHLKETADIEKVVSALEEIPFGQGSLSVDIKKAKEENIEVQPKDIDPYTLYVGNLPLNVTKQRVIQKYPGCTRIDIGHPQQLKNTRYAFVRFGNVDDAINAYKNTRNTQFESRSLIVRFRRINGNVGVPGENKQPNPPKPKTEVQPGASCSDTSQLKAPISSAGDVGNSSTNKNTLNDSNNSLMLDLNIVKDEPLSDNEDNYDMKPPNGFNTSLIKREIKNEPLDSSYDNEPFYANEDEVEHEEQDDDINDNYQYENGPGQEDYEDEDEYDDEDESGYDMDLNDSFLPYDDDGELFNGDV